MKWKEIETTKGVLKYRMPNVAEGFTFLSAIMTNKDVLSMKASFANCMSEMIDFKSIGYDSYTEFLNDIENNITPMAKITDDVYQSVIGALAKKNLSETA